MAIPVNDWLLCIPQYAISAAAILVLVISLSVFAIKSTQFHRKRVSHFAKARSLAKARSQRGERKEVAGEDMIQPPPAAAADGSVVSNRQTVLDAIDMRKLQEAAHHHHHHLQQHHHEEQFVGEVPLSQSFNEIFINRLLFTHRIEMHQFERSDRTNLFEEQKVHGGSSDRRGDEDDNGDGRVEYDVSGFANAMEHASSTQSEQQQQQQQQQLSGQMNKSHLHHHQQHRRSQYSLLKSGMDIELQNLTEQQILHTHHDTSTPAHSMSGALKRPQSLLIKVTPKSLLTPEFVKRKNEEFVSKNVIVPQSLGQRLLQEMRGDERLYWFDMPRYRVKKRKTLRNVVIYVALTTYLCVAFVCMSLFVVQHDNAL